ncbi:MAG TPA: LytTR family DNA-binding domain-containing protein [Chitinophagaceae bacterium]|nr:LytTR family DNA-binding domain-containing protein [Chitinophagaceae bacterium]
MKAVIIEDESIIAEELRNKINAVAPFVEVTAILPGLAQARKWLAAHPQPDLFFMDIQLGDGVSFELFETNQLTSPVIFTTAYDDYAIRAFKVNGVDYLLKPIDDEELSRAILKCKNIVESQASFPADIQQLIQKLSQPQSALPAYKQKFIVSHRRQWMPINTKDIACFLKENIHYLFTFTGEKHILDFTTLEEIEELLDPNVFYRANRQCIVHTDAIQTVTPHENQKLTLTLKAPLKMQVDISREKAPAFKKWMER